MEGEGNSARGGEGSSGREDIGEKRGKRIRNYLVHHHRRMCILMFYE